MLKKFLPALLGAVILLTGIFSATALAADSKILIAYFSWSGNTEKVAQIIQRETGGTLFKIQPANPYPTEYKACSDRASNEVATGARPAISNRVADMDSYDVVFVGFPIWWYNAPMIIDTFLESYDFSGKTVVPFCTSGGSLIGVSMDKIRLHCPDSNVVDGLTANRSSEVAPWIKKLGYAK